MSMNGDFWNYLYLGHAEGRMWVCYSIDRTIKKLSEVHLTFIINYFELRDEVIKNKEFLWVNAWHVCGGPWRGPFCILIRRLVCVVIVYFGYTIQCIFNYGWKNINFQEWRTLDVLSWKFYLNEKTTAQVSSFYDLYWREDLYKMHKNVFTSWAWDFSFAYVVSSLLKFHMLKKWGNGLS